MLRGANLFLVGMMGVGKTTVGRLLAQELHYGFCDTDAVVEQLTQQSIANLFATVGEAAFRQIETQVLAEVSAHTRLVIATGGGIVMAQQNWSYLQHGLVVWLDLPILDLYTRIQGDPNRPLLQHDRPQERLQELLEQRRSRYALADIHLAVTKDQTPNQVAAQVLAAIPNLIKPIPTPPTPGSFTLIDLNQTDDGHEA